MATDSIQSVWPGERKILKWTPQDRAYQYLFPVGGTLLIGIENDVSCTLAWLDQNRLFHSVHGFVPAGVPEEAQLGVDTMLEKVDCTVTLSFTPATPSQPATLQGTITLASGIGSGPVGTFDADAHPIGEEGPPHALP